MYYGKGYRIMPVFREQLSLQFKKPHKKQYGDSSTKINLKNIFFLHVTMEHNILYNRIWKPVVNKNRN